ncbi:hypothetical protein EZJ43_07715 [Pedobacter changchengzhani]|uniref:Uncharacterized protein n=1 Tax=Pedobacter changchengzhani TaxID=2529274 RepID=A0A4R5MLN7_9SPHI|nr:hypothetical protein [Pedobacter changchengzhani]TDG36396.1 hypothetical protein EZJ43_07715 [Pedobacter changchengzhani]
MKTIINKQLLHKILREVFLCKFFLVTSVLITFSITASAQKTNNIAIGYLENYEKLPKIKLEQTTEAEYNKYKISGKPDLLKIKETETHFTLPTKVKKIKLKKTNGALNDFDGYEYLGYYPKLKMYAITDNSIADNLTFSTFVLIDSLTAQDYSIVSIGDGAVETPIQSINSNYLLYYYNRPYRGDGCFIGLLAINKNGRPQHRFKEKMSFNFESKGFSVEGIKWVDDKSFIAKTYVTKIVDNKSVKEFSFYKAIIN